MLPWGSAKAFRTTQQSAERARFGLAVEPDPAAVSHSRDLGPCRNGVLAHSTHHQASGSAAPSLPATTQAPDRAIQVTLGECMPPSLPASLAQLSGGCLGAPLPCSVLTAPGYSLKEGRRRVGGGWGPRPSEKDSKAGLGWKRGRRGSAPARGAYLRKRVQGEGGDGADGQQRGRGGGAGPRGGHSTVGRGNQRHLPLQQLQDGGHVCTQPGLQPGARRRRVPWVSGKWRHQ